MKLASSEKVDLSTVVHTFVIPTESIDNSKCFWIIPSNINKQQQYYASITNSVDTLVITDEYNIEDLDEYKNLKEIIILSNRKYARLRSWADEHLVT